MDRPPFLHLLGQAGEKPLALKSIKRGRPPWGRCRLRWHGVQLVGLGSRANTPGLARMAVPCSEQHCEGNCSQMSVKHKSWRGAGDDQMRRVAS